MLPERKLIRLENWEKIEERYRRWSKFLDEKVVFSRTGTSIHGKLHCARVLLYALSIGEQKNLIETDLEALATAAVFHDSRRFSDGLDAGHGKRAADYYQEFCSGQENMFDERVYLAIAYHDLSDKIGRIEIEKSDLKNGILLYEILKDADALDRFRLGREGLDIRYLRADKAKTLVDFARDMVEY